MPTYYARGVSVRLGVQPLADTITPRIVLKKGETAKTQCEEVERKLLDSNLIRERHIQFPDDKAGFELNWLGGAPFMQVRAGDDLFTQDRSEGSAYPARTTVDTFDNDDESEDRGSNKPLALSLHVKLSDKTFVSGLNTYAKLHLKIDVFFNGELSSCLFIPFHDVRSRAKTYHQVFGGCRVDYLAERPWVVRPPQKMAGHGEDTTLTIEKRWEEICQALAREADERGMNKHGEIPPTAEYLRALASMRIPEETKSMQRSGSRKFGVVDVIITAGDGRKITNGTGYLKAPQRLIDENYPVRIISDDEKNDAPSTGHNEARGGRPRRLCRATHKIIDVDAEGEDDPDYGPPAKRKALARRVLSLPPKEETVPVSTLPPNATDAPTPPISTSMASDSTPSMPYASEKRNGVSEALSPAERGGICQQDSAGCYERRVYSSASCSTLKSFHTLPGDNSGCVQTPQMRPSLYSFPFSGTMSGHDSSSSPIGPTSFSKTDFLSSPLLQSRANLESTSSQSPCHATMRRSGLHEEVKGSAYSASNQFPPASLNQGAVSSTPASQSATISPWYRDIPDHDMYSPTTSLQFAGDIPNMLPALTSFNAFSESSIGGIPIKLHYDRQSSMPLPPTGMFCVPTKPRSRQSQPKKSHYMSTKRETQKLNPTRLIITGRGGTILVDHRFTTARRGSMERGSHRILESANFLSNSLKNSSNAATSCNDIRAEISPEIPTSKQYTSSPDASSACMRQASVRKKECEPRDSSDLFSPPSLVPDEEMSVKQINLTMGNSDAVCKPMNPAPRIATRMAMPQRRATSGTHVTGVQGPKATTFWLEDPEEVLREASRLRRSRSPVKRRHKGISRINPATSAQVKNTLAGCATDPSSPLSSLPNSPESGHGVKAVPVMPRISSPTRTSGSISQLDGSIERRTARLSPNKAQAPSPTTELVSTSTPLLTPNASSHSKPSRSPNRKKCKAIALTPGRYLAKQPRSPDRLKTVSNPPLNQKCVIALAESEGRDSESGVLRQIRGERQGVFAEKYVVLATRFFVAGS